MIKLTQFFNYRSVSHTSDQTTSKKLIENDKDLRESFPKAYKKLKKLNEFNTRKQLILISLILDFAHFLLFLHTFYIFYLHIYK